MKKKRFQTLLDFFLVALVISSDLISKNWAEKSLSFPSSNVPLPVFRLTFLHNYGIAFGMFPGLSSFLLWFTGFFILAMFVYLLFFPPIRPIHRALLAIILGGAAGNWIDRLNGGGVVDFLDFGIGVHRWPAFNIADSSITCAGIILFITFLCEKKEKSMGEESKEGEEE